MKNSQGIFEEALKRDESFNAIRDKVDAALTRAIRSGRDMDGDGDGDQDVNDYAWVQDLYPSVVVYSMNGRLYQADYSIDADDNVTIGTPKEVEITYSPVGESARLMLANVSQLKESAYDSTAGEFPVKIIEAGMSKNKRFYPADVLKRDFRIFEGAKMFADHQTDSEAKSRPEGSVNNWVATLKGVYAESDGTLRGKAVVIDPTFKAKLATLAEKGLLTEMGISIRAIGAGHKQLVKDVEATYVESLIACRSVDFVTFAGAGGQVEAMESAANEFDLDLVTEAQLRERRPDLVQLIESKEKSMNKPVEQQLREALDEIKDLRTKLTDANTKLEAAESTNRKNAAGTELARLLTESKLPEKAKDRIRAQFKEAEKAEGMKEAIDAEEKYIADLGVPTAVAPRSKNLGAKDNEVQESAATAGINLVEAYMATGLTKQEAEIAAGVVKK